MSSFEIYHNPCCSKSRATLAILESEDLNFDVHLYLEDPLTKKELTNLLSLLSLRPIDICRMGDSLFKDLGLDKSNSDDVILAALEENPILVERPIIVKDRKQAVLGRPPENVYKLID